MDETIVCLLGSGLLLLFGLGIMVYVIKQQLHKMQSEQQETGFYPRGYFAILGYVYGIPFNILLLGLFAYFKMLSDPTWALIIWISFIIPGHLITLFLEKKHADVIETISKKDIRKVQGFNRVMVMIVLLSVFLIYKFHHYIF